MFEAKDLKDPLISAGTKKDLNGNFMFSYMHPDRCQKPKDEQEEQKPEEKPSSAFQKLDFKYDSYNSYIETGSGEGWDFYKNATAFHKIPVTQGLSYCVNPTNPSIFALFQRASSHFKEMDLKEFMCMEDYRQLCKIRLRNYLNLLRMIPKITKLDPQIFNDVKKKLFQIKPVLSYLSVASGSLFEKLQNSLQPFDLDYEEQEINISNLGGDQEEEEQDTNDEDVEMIKFFSQSRITSYLSQYNWESYTQELLKEEKKWELRAKWLEDLIETKFKTSKNLAVWVPWFEAKLNQLANLDLPVKGQTLDQCPQVFYLFNFVKEQMTDPGVVSQKDQKDTQSTYGRDQQVYISEENLYPQLNFQVVDQSYTNDDIAVVKRKLNLREKLCLRVLKREIDTDYIVTVFKKDSFGNEKLFEKRINTREKECSLEKLEFSPTGAYLHISLNLSISWDSWKDRSDPNNEFGEQKYSQLFDLVFNLSAEFKDPLLIKPNSQVLGFKENKLFGIREETYIPPTLPQTADAKDAGASADSAKNAEVSALEEEKKSDGSSGDQQQPSGEEPPQVETQKVFVVYEYDLFDYKKIRTFQLNEYQGLSEDDIREKNFGLLNNGFYFIKKKPSPEKDAKTHLYDVYINKNVINITDKFEGNPKLYMNENGTRLLIAQEKEDKIPAITRYILDGAHSRLLRKEELRFLKSHILEQANQNIFTKLDWRVIPLGNDFIIAHRSDKAVAASLFLNDTFVANIDADIYQLHFNQSDNPLSNIYIFEKDSSQKNQQVVANSFSYVSFELLPEKKEYLRSATQCELINKQVCVQYPYVYFLYNHDQVFMKDLTQEESKGYYYMNHFMAIGKRMRPLTMHAYPYNGKMCLNVPVVHQNYTTNEFVLRVHQIKTHFYQSSNPNKWFGLIRYRVYAYTQLLSNNYKFWANVLVNEQQQLQHEVKVYYKNHALYIESRNKAGQLNQRYIVTQYYESPQEKVDPADPSILKLNFIKRGFWLVVSQTKENIEIFCHLMRYYFRRSELLGLEPVFSLLDDDQQNKVFNIMIDTMVKDQIDLYILYQNATMKKYSTPITQNGDKLAFVENEMLFTVEPLFKSQGGAPSATDGDDKKGGSGTAATKGTNLEQCVGNRDLFIANGIFYSQAGIIDFNAVMVENKIEVGVKIDTILRYVDSIKKFTYSLNEAKLAAFYEYSNSTHLLVLTALPNVRMLPMFIQGQFRTPVAPIVNKQEGYTSVFSINIHQVFSTPYLINQGNWYYTVPSHEIMKKAAYENNVNLYPGILIKYFNGVEQIIPIKERFLEIKRYSQSRNGDYVLLVGTKVDEEKALRPDRSIGYLSEERTHSGILEKLKDKDILMDGMFLYKIGETSIELVTKIEFAELKTEHYPENLKNKALLGVKTIQQYVEAEIDYPLIGELSYWDSSYQNPNLKVSSSYLETIDFKTTDDEYKDIEKRKQQKLLEEEEKKSWITKKKDTTANTQVADPAAVAQNAAEGANKEEETKMNLDKSRYNMPLPFDEFDIPYYPSKSYYAKQTYENLMKERIIGSYERAIVKPEGGANAELIEQPAEDVQPFSMDFERFFESVYSSDESSKIEKIHENMHLTVNEDGRIMLIDRLRNLLYFFYKPNVEEGGKTEYKLKKIKFEYDFPVDNVDSSGDYLVVWNKDRYIVLDISTFLNNSISAKYQDYFHLSPLTDHFEMYNIEADHTKSKQKGLTNKIYVEFDSLVFSQGSGSNKIKEEIVGQDKYTCQFNDIKIFHERNEADRMKDTMYCIIKQTDLNDTKYVKIFDFTRQVLLYYIEADQAIFSGDKQYMWILGTNEVLDIKNSLSTFLIWPGGQINNLYYAPLDNFNVLKDRTVMITPGYLQLSFNFLNVKIHEKIRQNFYFPIDAKGLSEVQHLASLNPFLYLCYKISEKNSCLGNIFNQGSSEDELNELKAIKDSDTEEKIKEREKKISEKQQNQMKIISSLITYMEALLLPDTYEKKHVSSFFLSFSFTWDPSIESFGGEDEEEEIPIQLQEGARGNIFQRLLTFKEKRQDVIEDILRFVVDGIEVPISQRAINTCFTQFLDKANSSIAFQNYLESMIMQTTQMQAIEKMQIDPRPDRNIVSHSQPIIDDLCLTQIKKLEEAKKDVEVHYIFLGDLLKERGEEIMGILKDEKFIDLMSTPTFKYLVNYQWNMIKNEIKNRLLYPFMALLFLFSIYSMYFVNYIEDTSSTEEATTTTTETSTATDALTNTSSSSNTTTNATTLYAFVLTDAATTSSGSSTSVIATIFNVMNLISLSLVLFYFLYNEVKQFTKSAKEYFSSFWNVLDLINYSLCLFTILFDITNVNKGIIRPVAAMCFIILWIKMFYFLRVFDTTSQLIRMIVEIVNDMQNFMIVLLIGILGFAGGLYILQMGLGPDPTSDDPESPIRFVGEDAFSAFIYSYRMSMGDFQLDDFAQYSSQGLTFEYYLIWIIFILGSLFLVIVLLNLLIAIMGDTFSRVLESIQNLKIREKVMLIAENENLLDRKLMFKHAQYLIIVNEKGLEGGPSEADDGQVNVVKRELIAKLASVETDLKASLNETQVELRKKFQDQDDKSKKLSILTEAKFTTNMKTELEKVSDTVTMSFNNQQKMIRQSIAQVQKQVSTIYDTVKAVKMMQDQFAQFQAEHEKFAKAVYQKCGIKEDGR